MRSHNRNFCGCEERHREYDVCHARLGNRKCKCGFELKLIGVGVFMIAFGILLLSCSIR